MQWRVNCQRLAKDNAKHPGFEVVTADKKYVQPCGALSFSNIIAALVEAEAEKCGELCKSGKPCVRRKGHSMKDKWKHKDYLSPKEPRPDKLIGVRDFAPGYWSDVVIVDGD